MLYDNENLHKKNTDFYLKEQPRNSLPRQAISNVQEIWYYRVALQLNKENNSPPPTMRALITVPSIANTMIEPMLAKKFPKLKIF